MQSTISNLMSFIVFSLKDCLRVIFETFHDNSLYWAFWLWASYQFVWLWSIFKCTGGFDPSKGKERKKGGKMIFTASAVLDVTGDHCSPDSAVSAVICWCYDKAQHISVPSLCDENGFHLSLVFWTVLSVCCCHCAVWLILIEYDLLSLYQLSLCHQCCLLVVLGVLLTAQVLSLLSAMVFIAVFKFFFTYAVDYALFR